MLYYLTKHVCYLSTNNENHKKSDEYIFIRLYYGDQKITYFLEN